MIVLTEREAALAASVRKQMGGGSLEEQALFEIIDRKHELEELEAEKKGRFDTFVDSVLTAVARAHDIPVELLKRPIENA